MISDPISGEEKRSALERVLESRTFCRSDQLRGFLRYICEAEFDGRAQQLNEYVLGVSVLGRPAHYSPAEDSCVRSRAYELRNKLKSYYQSEAPDDPIQIEIEKGAYVPRFQRRVPPLAAEQAAEIAAPGAGVPVASHSEQSVRVQGQARRLFRVAAWVVVVLLASGLLHRFWSMRQGQGAKGFETQVPSREMDALWKPFLDPSVPLLISFDIRLFLYAPATGLVVRDYQTNQLAEATKSKPLAEFQERMGTHELQETFDYADFGAVHAAFLLGRLLKRDVGLKHSSSLGWDDFWNSNIIFIGKPNLNPTIRYSLQGRDLVETEFGSGIRNLHPLPGEPELYRTATTHGAGEKYALITVLPGPQPGRHMMILSGSGAELMWALAESVTNPTRVREIFSHLLLPSGECPAAFQIVIQATFESNVPVKIRYVTHRVSRTQ